MMLALRRLGESATLRAEAKRDARVVLVAMTVLVRVQTPKSLFRGWDADARRHEGDAATGAMGDFPGVFCDDEALDAAVEALQRFGLLRRADDARVVGAMHQLMQRVVREQCGCGRRG